MSDANLDRREEIDAPASISDQRGGAWPQLLLIAAVGLGLVLIPALDLTTIDLLILFASYCALAISWNWVGGVAGLLNLAHVAYYAIGAYACAVAVISGFHPLFGIVLGALVAGIFACAVSMLSFKLKVTELYYTLLTLTLAEATASIARGLENEYSLGGLLLPFRNEPLQLAFLDKTYYYYILVGLVVVLLAFQYLVQRSKWGLLIIGSRDSAKAAAAVGVPVAKVLTLVSVASAVPAALTGSVFALTSLFVTADNVFPFDLLLAIIIAASIGGVGSLWGPVVGSVFVIAVQELIRRVIGVSDVAGASELVYGAMLIVIILLVPGGAASAFRRIFNLGRTRA